MYKLLVALFFLSFCYTETEACEWWHQRHQNIPVVVVQPQPVLVSAYQYPVIVYQQPFVVPVPVVPVIESRVVYYPIPVNSYYLSNQYRY